MSAFVFFIKFVTYCTFSLSFSSVLQQSIMTHVI